MSNHENNNFVQILALHILQTRIDAFYREVQVDFDHTKDSA